MIINGHIKMIKKPLRISGITTINFQAPGSILAEMIIAIDMHALIIKILRKACLLRIKFFIPNHQSRLYINIMSPEGYSFVIEKMI
jgi:hypothetical protein